MKFKMIGGPLDGTEHEFQGCCLKVPEVDPKVTELFHEPMTMKEFIDRCSTTMRRWTYTPDSKTGTSTGVAGEWFKIPPMWD